MTIQDKNLWSFVESINQSLVIQMAFEDVKLFSMISKFSFKLFKGNVRT